MGITKKQKLEQEEAEKGKEKKRPSTPSSSSSKKKNKQPPPAFIVREEDDNNDDDEDDATVKLEKLKKQFTKLYELKHSEPENRVAELQAQLNKATEVANAMKVEYEKKIARLSGLEKKNQALLGENAKFHKDVSALKEVEVKLRAKIIETEQERKSMLRALDNKTKDAPQLETLASLLDLYKTLTGMVIMKKSEGEGKGEEEEKEEVEKYQVTFLNGVAKKAIKYEIAQEKTGGMLVFSPGGERCTVNVAPKITSRIISDLFNNNNKQ